MAVTTKDAAEERAQVAAGAAVAARESAAPPAATRGAAFFDFDNTLLAGDAGVVFGRSLAGWAATQAGALKSPVAKAAFYARLGALTGGVVAQGAALGALTAARLVKRSTLLRETYKFFKGLPTDPVIERMGLVFEERIASRIYPEMRAIVHEHREAGHRVAIVTTGPSLLIGHARRFLGEDVDVLGVELLVENGRFTGDVDGPLWGMEKRTLLDAYAKEHSVDLAESWAYSDHHSDLAFLEAVGHPVAVNPTRRLRSIAHRRGWLILEPRKPSAE